MPVTEFEDHVVKECTTHGQWDVRCTLTGLDGRACNWVGHAGACTDDIAVIIKQHQDTWTHQSRV